MIQKLAIDLEIGDAIISVTGNKITMNTPVVWETSPHPAGFMIATFSGNRPHTKWQHIKVDDIVTVESVEI